MKISGFTISRNAVKYGYPILESMRSLLPLVDELVVGVGDSEDRTWEVISNLGDSKIKPFRTVWDMTKRQGGIVLSEQTNLALERCTGDWAVYLQGDEALHEDEIETIRRRLRDHLDRQTEGLSFSYIHFYGSYSTVQDNWCRWYRREVRAVKTGKGIVSVGDAAGFKIKDGPRMRRLIRADSGAHVYHYGWARPPVVMSEKRQHVEGFYQGEGQTVQLPEVERLDVAQPYRHLGDLARFKGTHPTVMKQVIAAQDWAFDSQIETQAPRWLRYLRILRACPRDSARIFVSRLMLAWNSNVHSPKIR